MGQGGQEFAQVAVAVDAVDLASLQQRVQVGAGVSPGDRVREEPVAAADHEGADRVLARVVVDRVGVLSQNRRNFRHPSSSPATSASRSIILPSLWKV